jgi:hypothetical protein
MKDIINDLQIVIQSKNDPKKTGKQIYKQFIKPLIDENKNLNDTIKQFRNHNKQIEFMLKAKIKDPEQ